MGTDRHYACKLTSAMNNLSSSENLGTTAHYLWLRNILFKCKTVRFTVCDFNHGIQIPSRSHMFDVL